MPGFLYSFDLVLCQETAENLKVILRCFLDLCKRRGLKVSPNKKKVMVLAGRKDRYVRSLFMRQLELVLEKFKYLGYVLNESSSEDGKCHRKVVSVRKVVVVIRSLVNAGNLQL